MKTARLTIPRPAAALLIGLALLLGGCGNSAQQQAYEQAASAERQLTAENSPAIIAQYKRVIARQPGSNWAKKAQARIDALEARARADELHKSVFQEHGID
jgi:outer membrane protein assembly factor BamD (BamD/ComL family)